MANELIFRASDTTTGLEKVQEKLGPNAYILSIQKVGKFVEITASMERPAEEPVERVKDSAKVSELGVKEMNAFADEPEKDTSQFPDTSKDQPSFGITNVFSEEPSRMDEPTGTSGAQPSEENDISAEVPLSKSEDAELKQKSNDEQKPATSEGFSYGDLLNLGLNESFLNDKFNMDRFNDVIEKSILVETVAEAFFEPNSEEQINAHDNLIFMGPPGVGKSTLCAQFMHLYGPQAATKPRILHLTPEKLFEADRLKFHAKLFNFSFKRENSFQPEEVLASAKQITEISWDFQVEFSNFYSQNTSRFPWSKVFLVLDAGINYETLVKILNIYPRDISIIINKCDFARFSVKNLMLLYLNGGKVSILSGDRVVSKTVRFVDFEMMKGFVEHTLGL